MVYLPLDSPHVRVSLLPWYLFIVLFIPFQLGGGCGRTLPPYPDPFTMRSPTPHRRTSCYTTLLVLDLSLSPPFTTIPAHVLYKATLHATNPCPRCATHPTSASCFVLSGWDLGGNTFLYATALTSRLSNCACSLPFDPCYIHCRPPPSSSSY